MKSISLLIGAGFSAPAGYPTGDKLNALLLNCKADNFKFTSYGALYISPKPGNKTSYDVEFDFCMELMQYFKMKNGHFDYEEFYDFFRDEAIKDAGVEKIAQPYLNSSNVKQLLFSLTKVYVQVVSYYLKDKNNKKWYDDESYSTNLDLYEGYTGILKYLHQLSKEYIINIHSLNHDLLFESFGNTAFMAGEISDGFEEQDSPYYGDKWLSHGHTYRTRLSRYTGKYDKQFRLYKLHGSRDYGVYYKSEGSIASSENYFKIKSGIGFDDIYKEVKNTEGVVNYEHCWLNYHADFLIGKTSKIERYKEPLLYKNIFENFTANLEAAEQLIIIGYGGRDSEVNKLIIENFDYKNKPVYIIDPFAGSDVKDLALQIKAKLIDKQLEELNAGDF
ncbi:MAG: hypothetical protein V4538_06300 [Bacteroidota bacterium]